ncbi:MAG TPA: hypothetical protein VGQ83_25345 [Polyangia bacterium]|jgi:hypothetical protein
MTAAERKAALARFRAKNPRMMRVKELDFYLAGVVDSAFFLPRETLAEAYEILVAHARRRKRAEPWADVATAESLDECFAQAGVHGLTHDRRGNVTGLAQGGDEWAFDLLAPIARLVRDGSFFLMEDDEGRFWKASFEGGELVYYRQASGEDWLARVREVAAVVTRTLEAAGWTRDAAGMAAKKADIERFWGPRARAGLDPQTPVTRLTYERGPLRLAVEYMAKGTLSSITMELATKKPPGLLGLTITYTDSPAPVLDAIVAAQDTLSRRTLRTWLKAMRKQFKTEVTSESGILRP